MNEYPRGLLAAVSIVSFWMTWAIWHWVELSLSVGVIIVIAGAFTVGWLLND